MNGVRRNQVPSVISLPMKLLAVLRSTRWRITVSFAVSATMQGLQKAFHEHIWHHPIAGMIVFATVVEAPGQDGKGYPRSSAAACNGLGSSNISHSRHLVPAHSSIAMGYSQI